MSTSRRFRIAGALAPVVALLACRTTRSVLPVEPGVTFAAHRAGDGFVIDRLRSGDVGALERRGRLQDPDTPKLLLRVGDQPRLGLWTVGRSRILVRDGISVRSPRSGEILSSWDNGAIRLTLYPERGAPLETSVFHRQGTATDRVLSRADDASGTYRATVREVGGADVGWLRVDVGSETVPRFYDAVLPERVDDGLAAAAVVALDTELDWITGHRAEGD